MKTLRYYSIIFTLFITLYGLNAVETAAQTQSSTLQIAKNSVENKTTQTGDETTDKEENRSSFTNTTGRSAPNLTRLGVQNSQTMPLTLNEAIRKALENNNDIEIAKNDVKIAESTLRSLLGIYDPVFNVSPSYVRSSTNGQKATSDFRVNSDFNQQIQRGGGNYQVFLNNSRTENQFSQQQATSGTTSTGGALFSTRLGVTYTQPLWRNLKTDQTRRQIKIQRKRVSQSDADFRRQAILIISQVQTAYWDLVFSLRNQQNQVANVNLSRENLRQIEAKISAGSAAPLQKAEVETELANREGELLNATQQVSVAENRLKQLFLKDPNATEWQMSLVPTDAPVLNDEPIDMDGALKDAMEFRPELSRLRLDKEINKIDLDYYKNQTKPRIDLNTTFSLDGLSLGNVNTNSFLSPLLVIQPVGQETSSSSYFYNLICNSNVTRPTNCSNIPSVIVPGSSNFLKGGFNRSFANLFRSDSPNLTVGVTFSFPLRNKTAKADLATARYQSERIDAQTRSQEQTVIAEVRNAVQAVETSRQRIATAIRARENAEIQLEGERKLFEAGRSTTFLLFQRENSLTNARNAEIRAETDYNKALSDLQRVTSTTFRVNNIQVDSPMSDQK
jgi:outer membrane protein TolC